MNIKLIKIKIIDFVSRRIRKCPFLYRKLVKLYVKCGFSKYEQEEKVCWGNENSQNIYFVIRCNDNNLGLMAYFNSALGRIKDSIDKGYIPVVDMQNYRTPYLKPQSLGKTNAWEQYFLQPMKIGINDIGHSRNIILSSGKSHQWGSPRVLGEVLKDKKNAEAIGELISKYIILNDRTKKHIDKAMKILEGKRVVGVLSRGTDLLGNKGHSVQPTTEELMSIVKTKMRKGWGDFIFLASEEQSVIDLFRERFGSEVILTAEAEKFDKFDGKLLSQVNFGRKDDEYLKGLEYLTTIWLLSKCNALISTFVGGSVAALAINGGRYENVELIDLGVY